MTKLAIFGDSFSSELKGYSWITYLRNEGMSIDNYSVPGTSVWYSFKKFLDHYDNYNSIIFCYSHCERIITIPANLPERLHCLNQSQYWVGLKEDKITMKTITDYHLMTLDSDKRLYYYLYQKNFVDINTSCNIKNIRLINLMPFESEEYLFKYPLDSEFPPLGPCLYNLYEVSLRELAGRNFPIPDSRECHMNLKNNSLLGKIIFDYLFNTKNDMIDTATVLNN